MVNAQTGLSTLGQRFCRTLINTNQDDAPLLKTELESTMKMAGGGDGCWTGINVEDYGERTLSLICRQLRHFERVFTRLTEAAN
jgi:hypothetical protein